MVLLLLPLVAVSLVTPFALGVKEVMVVLPFFQVTPDVAELSPSKVTE